MRWDLLDSCSRFYLPKTGKSWFIPMPVGNILQMDAVFAFQVSAPAPRRSGLGRARVVLGVGNLRLPLT